MPTTLECLYQFIAYSDEEDPSWSITSLPIGLTKRLYRVMYKKDDVYEQEITIDISEHKQQLAGYKQLLVQLSQDSSYCQSFRLACHELLEKDPWL